MRSLFSVKLGVMVALMALAGAAMATAPTPAFDWSADITAMRTDVVTTVGANIGAVFLVFALFVVMAFIWRMLRKAGARTT